MSKQQVKDQLSNKTKVYELKPGDTCYITGAFVQWTGKGWELISINDDMYYDGRIVNEGEDDNGIKHDAPFVEVKDE